jgi:hypothetical protein
MLRVVVKYLVVDLIGKQDKIVFSAISTILQ